MAKYLSTTDEFINLWSKDTTPSSTCVYSHVSDIQGLINLMLNPERSYWTTAERVNFGFGRVEFPADPI